MNSRIYRHPDLQTTAAACAQHILSRLDDAIRKNSRANLAISGGSSPKPMFEIFSKTVFPWDHVQLYWVDERGVPPEDPQSNFGTTRDAWLAPGKFPAANIHRIEAELDARIAAERYAAQIRGVEFDVIHQGMGPDAHTASLFPGDPLIDDRQGLAAATWVEKFKQWRITMLPGVLIAARHTVMEVCGADKAPALRAVLRGEAYEPQKYPAQIIAHEARDSAWFVDEAAAAQIG
jgi:6-phosphogluconolactonase